MSSENVQNAILFAKSSILRAIYTVAIMVVVLSLNHSHSFAETSINNYKISNTKDILIENFVYARLSSNVYHSTTNDSASAPKGYDFIDREDDPESGFTAITYKNIESGKIIISFGGTATKADWKADFSIAGGEKLNSQYEQANTLYKKIKEAHPENEIELTGHSLGGSLAQYVSVKNIVRAVTFNSAPYPAADIKYSRGNYDSNIINIRTSDDPLSLIIFLLDDAQNKKLTIENITEYNAITSQVKGLWYNISGYRMTDDYIINNIEGVVSILKQLFDVSSNISVSDLIRGNQFVLNMGGGHGIDNIARAAASEYHRIEEIKKNEGYPNTDVADDDKGSLPETVTITPTPPATGKYFGLLSYFAKNENTFLPNNGGTGYTQFNGYDDKDQLVNSVGFGGTESGRYGLRPRNTDALSFVNAEPDSDEERDFTLFNNAYEGQVNTDRFGPGVFTNLQGKPYDGYQYKHTAWGKWNGEIIDVDIHELNNGSNTLTRTGKRGFWVVGENTSADAIAARTGSATYNGAFVGDYLAKGSNVIQKEAAYGNVAFNMNFEDNTLIGRAGVNLKLQNGTLVSNWFNESLGSGIISPNIIEDYRRWFEATEKDEGDFATADAWKNNLTADEVTLFNTLGPVFQLENAADDESWNAQAVGLFYGNNGTEVGGTLNIEKDRGTNAGEVVGVFRAQEQAP